MMQEEEQGWSFSDNQICPPLHFRSVPQAGHQKFRDRPVALQLLRRRPSVELDEVMEIIGNTVADY